MVTRLRMLRTDAGYKICDIARSASIPEARLAAFDRGDSSRRLTAAEIQSVANFLGVDVNDIGRPSRRPQYYAARPYTRGG